MEPALQMPPAQFTFCVALIAGAHSEKTLLHFSPVGQCKQDIRRRRGFGFAIRARRLDHLNCRLPEVPLDALRR